MNPLAETKAMSKAHAELKGLGNCAKCHPAGKQLAQANCLSCHEELTPRITKGLGLHGRIKEDKRACQTCHPEHRGPEFDLIDYGPNGKKGFDHQRTGWTLKGKHAELAALRADVSALATSFPMPGFDVSTLKYKDGVPA